MQLVGRDGLVLAGADPGVDLVAEAGGAQPFEQVAEAAATRGRRTGGSRRTRCRLTGARLRPLRPLGSLRCPGSLHALTLRHSTLRYLWGLNALRGLHATLRTLDPTLRRLQALTLGHPALRGLRALYPALRGLHGLALWCSGCLHRRAGVARHRDRYLPAGRLVARWRAAQQVLKDLPDAALTPEEPAEQASEASVV
jgi:hypothetical protein